MSLVSDALRKARQEAAEREAQRRGAVGTSPAAGVVARGRFASGLLLGAVIAVVAAAVGATAVWWWLAQPGATADPSGEHPPTAEAKAVPNDAASERQSEPASPAETSVDQLAESSGAEVAVDVGATDRVVVPADGHGGPGESGGLDDSQAADGAVADGEIDDVASPTDGDAATPDNDGVREFVLDADLGYAQLSLGYVVFRASDPYAEINGRLVHEGWRIEGFVVEEITATTVRLRDDRGELILRAR